MNKAWLYRAHGSGNWYLEPVCIFWAERKFSTFEAARLFLCNAREP